MIRHHRVYYEDDTAPRAAEAPRRARYTRGVTSAGLTCVSCSGNEQDVRLHKCQICFKWSCENCGTARYGRMFCSEKCAKSFFFGDEDDAAED